MYIYTFSMCGIKLLTNFAKLLEKSERNVIIKLIGHALVFFCRCNIVLSPLIFRNLSVLSVVDCKTLF